MPVPIQKSVLSNSSQITFRSKFVTHIYLQIDRELLSHLNLNEPLLSTSSIPQQLKNQVILQQIFQNFRHWNWEPE